ncbi:NAD-binding protein [Fomitiporia mediterranea MF3/22]|uniref:NAD-binding protein n=1 Tax=Fomitiporia mediterranea (strain MF3/22) TaxID=694068 RepID=UPI0004409393|nr:NAD-binding protein [Fomitiporia mediterranea MF3/22]EJD04777.1 NAD-binding protein [Fomitiporia mediterranea MF3/22]
MGQTLTVIRTGFDQSRPPKPTFTIDDVPDLSGKVVIVTGGYAGIGLETVRVLLKKNAKVYFAGRNKAKAEAVISELSKDTRKEAIFLELDLASLKSVKKAAEEYMSKETQLHVLFNNGGVMQVAVEQLTVDGYDLHFGTNVLADSHVRVVTTSSYGHMLHASSNIRYDTLRDTPEHKKFGTLNLYNQSKFGNVLIARELARRYGDQGIVSTSLNPGNITSELQRHLKGLLKKIILYAGTSPDAKDLNGGYLIPWARVSECRKVARDPKVAEELWKWCEEQVKDV